MIKSRFSVKELVILALLVAASSTSSFAQNHRVKILGKSCHDTTLKISIYNGGIIRTNDGYAFKIDPFAQFETEFWLAGDDLSICATRKLVDGREVTSYTLKDSFSPGDNPDGENAQFISGPDSK